MLIGFAWDLGETAVVLEQSSSLKWKWGNGRYHCDQPCFVWLWWVGNAVVEQSASLKWEWGNGRYH
jgi:hypothetical protein